MGLTASKRIAPAMSGCAQAAPQPPATAAQWDSAAFIAHRGAGKLAPENTLAAMRCGWRHGYRMFEFDARVSRDGTVVLMHDDTVQRTTNGHGRIADLDWAELDQLDAGGWHSALYAAEPVATLARVARWLQANGAAADLEIKPAKGDEARAGAIVAAQAAQLWSNTSPPLLSSFSERALAAAREVAGELPRGLLLDALVPDWLDRCQALDCVAVVFNHEWLDAHIIARARDAGLRTMTYTVNDPARATLLREWGLDALVTDAVDGIDPGA